jgi:hypothetical protein
MIPYLILAAAVFGLCFILDKGFARLFRGKQQHKSGLAVKPGKRTAVLGLFLMLLGVAGVLGGISSGTAMLVMSLVMLLLGGGLVVYYLSFGIYYDEETFLVSSFGRQDRVYRYEQIREQQRFVVQGGSVIVELHMENGSCVTVQTTMDGAYPFLDYAFARWCARKGMDPEACEFHDPAQHRWFPEAEVC